MAVENHFDKLKAFKGQIMALSLDETFIRLQNLSAEKLRTECLNLVQYLDSFPAKSMVNDQATIMALTWDSIRQCIIKVVGNKYLTFEKKIGMVALVPNGTYATLRVGYPAFVAGLDEHGIAVTFEKVREDDTYEEVYENGRAKIYHKKAKFSEKKVIGYYAIAVNKEGFSWVESMNLSEIDKRKKAAKTSFIWDAWSDEMAMKTPLLRLCNKYFRHYLTDLLTIDVDNEYKEIEGQEGIKALSETSDEKKPLTEEEKTALKESLSSAETRDLAMIELGRIELVYKERDTEISAKGRKYLIETFIDSRFNADGSPKLELSETADIPPVGTILITPYKPTAAILKEFGACDTLDALNDRIDVEITDLTLNNYDTAPFMEYAVRLREAFKIKQNAV